MKSLLLTIILACIALHSFASPDKSRIDTLIVVENVQITAVKQGLPIATQPVAATVIGLDRIRGERITDLKAVSGSVPNFFMPDYGSRITSSLYVRGMGTRIDNSAVGLTVDNVPLLDKNSFDTDMPDIARIELLRGPQTTLYGRNSMGGVINIYTLSPLSSPSGVRFGGEYATASSYKVHATALTKLGERTGLSVSGQFAHTDGLFTNLYDNSACDWANDGNARIRLQHRSKSGFSIDNTIAYSTVNQGGYPYAYMPTGRIDYNDECSYRRTVITEGLSLRKDWAKMALSSVSSYQYLDDRMRLDQDFLPVSYFTLSQSKRMHAATEDITLRSTADTPYSWLIGAFGFYNHTTMNAPVTFKEDGIEELIIKNIPTTLSWNEDSFVLGSNFLTTTAGGALYHQSDYTVGRWHFTAGIRGDYELTRLEFHKRLDTSCTIAGNNKPIVINEDGAMNQTFFEFAPRLSIAYRFGQRKGQMLYATVSRGYKSGGFNTQIFSEILRQDLIAQFGGEPMNEKEASSYKPERAWNYEIGARTASVDGRYRADMALFVIDCRNQQLTVFPEGELTGRRMTNAGRTLSYGAEATFTAEPIKNLSLDISYGYTQAEFRRFVSGTDNYRGNYVPYAPQHTLFASAAYTVQVGRQWLQQIVFSARVNGAGRIYWDEANEYSQPFYALLGATVEFRTAHYSIEVWGKNLTDTHYDTFCFASMGNRFLQRGKTRTMGIALNINL